MSESNSTHDTTIEGDTAATDQSGPLLGTRRAALAAAAAATAGFLADQALAPNLAQAKEEPPITSVNGVTGTKIVLPGLEPEGGDLLSTVVSESPDGTAWTSPERFGAVGNGVADDTKAFQEASEALSAVGGGELRTWAKTYIVDGYRWETGVRIVGHGARSAILKAKNGSANPAQVTMTVGRVRQGGWENITMLPNGNAGQHGMDFEVTESPATHDGGIWNCFFKNLEIGRNGVGEAWEGCAIRFRGGTASNLVHQFNTFENVQGCHANTGANATSSRAIVLAGKCEKFSFDTACDWSGANAQTKIGTNIELAQEGGESPKFIRFNGGAIENAFLGALVGKGCQYVEFAGPDWEYTCQGYKVEEGAYQINASGRFLNAASEGTSNGTGTLTVGSKIITAATGAWAKGSLINGPGIPGGTTVEKVSGTELEISASVQAEGVAGSAEKVPLVEGGNGEGAIAIYESGSIGTCRYHVQGAADRTIVGNGAGVNIDNPSLGSALLVQTTKGITLALPAAATMTVFSARDVAVTNAAEPVKNIAGTHGTGQTVTFRATTNGTKFEAGGNLYLPGGTLILNAGDFATFLKTDYSTLTMALVGVQRAHESSLAIPGLFAPVWGEQLTIAAETAMATAFKAVYQRAIVRQTGTLKKLYAANGGSINGKMRAAIADIGVSNSGHYTILWEGTEVEQAGTETWQALGEPNLAVTAGQELAIAFMSNSTTAKYGQFASHGVVGLATLPTPFEVGGLKPQVIGFHAFAELKFASLTELTNGGTPWAVIGRIE